MNMKYDPTSFIDRVEETGIGPGNAGISSTETIITRNTVDGLLDPAI